jgi:FMN reductase
MPSPNVSPQRLPVGTENRSRTPLILGIAGTIRPDSSSERALRVALSIAEREGAQVELVAGRDLELPPYDPANASRQGRGGEFVGRLRRANGMIISSAAYHGAMSGLLKNAIDYAEDLRADNPPYLEGRAVGCIACAQGAQALGSTLANMRSVVHALRGWNTPYSATLNTAENPFNERDVPHAITRVIEIMTRQVVDFATGHASLWAACRGGA